MWKILWMVCLLISAVPMPGARGAERAVLSDTVAEGEVYMELRLLGAVYLPSFSGGARLGGLSGLAWDADDQVLYAVSDVGRLLHLRPGWAQGRLVDVRVEAVYPLRDAAGRPLRGAWADAEGLTLERGANGIPGDARLLVSFEIQHRIRVFDRQGHNLGSEPLPPSLGDAKVFYKANASLEAITRHPLWGLLVAPERPLYSGRGRTLPVLAQNGRRWNYRLARAPGSALVAMEALADGSLVTLERAFVSLLHPLIITLRHTRLPETGELPEVRDIAVLDSSRGWLLDNFEGLAWHRNRRFFMVSDDNFNTLQSTLLVYFEWVADLPP